jgi:hypothetical protein
MCQIAIDGLLTAVIRAAKFDPGDHYRHIPMANFHTREPARAEGYCGRNCATPGDFCPVWPSPNLPRILRNTGAANHARDDALEMVSVRARVRDHATSALPACCRHGGQPVGDLHKAASPWAQNGRGQDGGDAPVTGVRLRRIENHLDRTDLVTIKREPVGILCRQRRTPRDRSGAADFRFCGPNADPLRRAGN